VHLPDVLLRVGRAGGGLEVGRAVERHRRVAVLALHGLVAVGAVDEVRVPAAVEQQNRLLAGVERLLEQELQPLREQVDAFAELVDDAEVDQLDLRQREAANAGREAEDVLRLRGGGRGGRRGGGGEAREIVDRRCLVPPPAGEVRWGRGASRRNKVL
jgi:hypothetical protein